MTQEQLQEYIAYVQTIQSNVFLFVTTSDRLSVDLPDPMLVFDVEQLALYIVKGTTHTPVSDAAVRDMMNAIIAGTEAAGNSIRLGGQTLAQVQAAWASDIATAVQAIVGMPPEDLNTLQEIAARLSEDLSALTLVNTTLAAHAVQIGQLQADLTAEVVRATAAEANLQSQITAEVSRATGVEAGIAGGLSTETTRAQNAENAIAADLTAEIARATAAEVALQDAIDAEALRAVNEEIAIRAEIGDVGFTLLGYHALAGMPYLTRF